MPMTAGQTSTKKLYSRQKDEGGEAVEEDLSHTIEGALDRRGNTWETD
jgi:hypothetical protein